MKPQSSKMLNDNLELILMVSLAVVILIPLVYGLASFAFSEGSKDLQSLLEKPEGTSDKCVLDAGYMRVNHMELLKELRDDSVREGRRGAVGLNSCMQCHRSREQFCSTCHDVAGVQVKCFECHYYPE